MDWFKPLLGGAKPGDNRQLPPANPLQIQRSRQIETLKQLQNVVEIQRDVEYQITLRLHNITIYLKIHLPPMFPQKPPVVYLTPPVTHPWVNEQNQVVGCRGINQFMMHSDLSRVMKELIDEFHRCPPIPRDPLPYAVRPEEGAAAAAGQQPPAPVSGRPYPVGGMAQPYPTAGGAGIRGAASQYQPQPAPALPVPAHHYMPNFPSPSLPPSTAGGGVRPPGQGVLHSAAAAPIYPPGSHVGGTTPLSHPHNMPTGGGSFLPALKDLTISELESINMDEDKLISLLLKSPELQKLSEDRAAMCDVNERMAKENMLRKPEIEEKKRVLLEKYDELDRLTSQFQESSEEQQRLIDRLSPANIRHKLSEAVSEADEMSEDIAQQFIKGKLDISEFISSYMSMRTKHHLRRVKEERFSGATMPPY